MASKVYIDVVVDDKGTTKKVAVDAKKLGESLNKTATSAHSADRRLKGAAQASSNGAKNFSKMAQGITGGLVPAYATLAANIFAISAAFNFLKEAADFKNLQASQISFAATTGNNLSAITAQLQDASGGMLRFREAAQASAIGAAKGFSTEQLTGLVEGARKASVALGRSFDDTFDRLLRGVSKAEPELLDELGITLRLAEATENYAQKNQLAADKLTTYQRSLAVLEETQRQVDENFGAINVDEITNPFVQLQKTFDDLIKTISGAVLPLFEGFANIINRSAGAAVVIFGAIGLSIFKAALPIEGMSEAMEEFDAKTEAAIQNAQADLDALDAKLKAVRQSGEDMVIDAAINVQDTAAQMVDRGSDSKILQKAKEDPFSLNKRDQGNMEKAFKSAEAQYKKHGKIKTGIFAGEDIKTVRHFKKSLKQMTTATLPATKKIGNFFQKAQVRIRKGFARTRKLASGAMKGIGKVTAGTGRLIGRVFSAAGALGAVFFAFQTFKELQTNVFDIMNNILTNVDKVLNFIGQSSIGGAILDGFSLAATGIAKIIQYIGGAVAGLFDGLMEGGAKAAEFLGFEKTAKELRGAGAAFMNFTHTAQVGMENLAEGLDAASEGQSNLAGAFRSSATGQAFKGIQQAAQDADKLKKAAEEAAEKLQTLAEGLAKIAEESAKLAKQGTTLTEFEQFMKRQRTVSTSGFAGIVNSLKESPEAITEEILTEMNSVFAKLSATGTVEFQNLFGKIGTITRDNLDQVAEGLVKVESAALTNVGTFKALEENLKGFQESLREGAMLGSISDLKLLQERFKQLTIDTEALKAAATAESLTAENFFFEKFGVSAEKFGERLTKLIDTLEKLGEASKDLGVFEAQLSRLSGGSKEDAANSLKIAKAQLELVEAQARQAALDDAIKFGQLDTDQKAAAEDELQALKNQLPILQASYESLKFQFSDIGRIGLAAGATLQSSFTSAFQSVVQGTMSMKDAFKSMAQSILKSLADIITKMMVIRLLESAFGGKTIGNFLGIADPGKSAAAAVPAPAGRYGGIMKGYAAGGIARGRNAGYPAILHGTEAVVPLPSGGKIPVEMTKGGSGDTNNVSVNVTMASDGSAKTDSQADGKRGGDLGKAISQAVQDELHKQKRPGGILSPFGGA